MNKLNYTEMTKDIEVSKKKEELLEELRVFVHDESSISNYKKFQELRQAWLDLGDLPSNKGALISNYNALLKIYYNNRNRIYHSLKNLDKQKKIELCEQVEELCKFNSARIDDWNEQTSIIKGFEKQWKNSNFKAFKEEERKEVNKRFWTGYKQFFKNKKQFFKVLDEERLKHYDAKEKLIEEAKALQESNQWLQTSKEIQTIQKRWKNIGEVPKHLREEQYQRFKEICDYFFDSFRDNRKSNLKLKKVTRLENKIKNWKNNLDFLGHSKGAEEIRRDYLDKIEEAEQYLEDLLNGNEDTL